MPQALTAGCGRGRFMPSRGARAMHIRTRKFIGGVLILAVLIVYALIAMVVGAEVAMEWPEPGRVAFYAAAGVLWLPLVMVIVRWMARPA